MNMHRVLSALLVALSLLLVTAPAEAATVTIQVNGQPITDLQEVMDTHELTRHADELQEIETAKEGLVNGRLGVCILCQRPIGYQRMLVHPVAQRCLACQELQERAGGNQNDNTV